MGRKFDVENMTLLTVKCRVKCPRDSVEVDVKESCLSCDCFLCMSYVSGLPLICCIYPKFKSGAILEAEKTGKPLMEVIA